MAPSASTSSIRTSIVLPILACSLAIGPSAVPATVAQQNEARLQAWQAQEDIRLEKQRQEQLALERERLKPQVLVVQQQDPWISNILAIPRFIGSLFGAK